MEEKDDPVMKPGQDSPEESPNSEQRKGLSSLDMRMAVDGALFVAATAVFLTARRRRRRRPRSPHAVLAYATLGLAALHIYQHRAVISRYCRKKRAELEERFSKS